MSQIASFTVLKTTDVSFLGFWSKPKSRLFRKPISKFPELLTQHALREKCFDKAEGIYVALIFAYLESQNKKFVMEKNPVLETLRKHLEGSHWLIDFEDKHVLSAISEPISSDAWISLLQNICLDPASFSETLFEEARLFIRNEIGEIQPEESLLVSVG